MKPVRVAPSGAVWFVGWKPHSWYASVLVTMKKLAEVVCEVVFSPMVTFHGSSTLGVFPEFLSVLVIKKQSCHIWESNAQSSAERLELVVAADPI